MDVKASAANARGIQISKGVADPLEEAIQDLVKKYEKKAMKLCMIILTLEILHGTSSWPMFYI